MEKSGPITVGHPDRVLPSGIDTPHPQSLSSLGFKKMPAKKRSAEDCCPGVRRRIRELTRNNAKPESSVPPSENTLPSTSSGIPRSPVQTPGSDDFSDMPLGGIPPWSNHQSRDLRSANTVENAYKMTKGGRIPPVSEPKLINIPTTPQPEKLGFLKWCKKTITSALGKKSTPPAASSFIDELRNRPASEYGKNTKKSPSTTGFFATAKNTIARTWDNTVQKYRKPAIAIGAAFGTVAAVGGLVYKTSSVKGNPHTHDKSSLAGDALMPEKKHHHRADNISPEFARFLWEQQKNAQKPKEPIYPTTLAETSFYRGSPSILGSTFQSVSFAMPQTRVTLDSLTEGSVALQPISKTTSHSVNQDASPKATTPSPETAAVDVPVGETISSSLVTTRETTPIACSVDGGTTKTPSSVTENTSKTAMFVISLNRETVVTITDTNGDGITVDEYRRELFRMVGGNTKKKEPAMFRLADTNGLNTDCFRAGHGNDTITISQILPGVTPVTGDFTADDGKTYTITANSQAALNGAIAGLTQSKNIAKKTTGAGNSGGDIITTETVQNIPRKAIPLTENELRELGLPVDDGDEGVLPDLADTDTLPPLEPIVLDATDVTTNHDPLTAEHIRKERRYQIASSIEVPTNQANALREMNRMIRNYQTMHDLSPDPEQRKMPFLEFYEKFITLRVEGTDCTETSMVSETIHHGGKTTLIEKEVRKKSLPKLREVARLAGLSDLTIAKLFGDDIPPRVIDAANHDGSLGTFDMKGWDQTEKLIFQAAKKQLGREPNLEELTKFVEDNVSFAEYPGLTYLDVVKKAIAERSQELAKAPEKIIPHPVVAKPEVVGKDTVSPSVTPPPPFPHSPSVQLPKKQWTWCTIRKGNEVEDFGNAVRSIQADFEVRKDFAKKGGRPCPWQTVDEFAKDCYIIKDGGGKVFTYPTALMRMSRLEPVSKK